MKKAININKNHFAQALFIVAVSILLMVSTAEAKNSITQNLEKAILAERWSEVSKLSPPFQSSTPTSLFISAHAFLFLNENNKSICYFAALNDKQEVHNNLADWQSWASTFVNNNPKSPVAHYFKCDSLARGQMWDEALKECNIALDLSPNHYLAMNARGAIYAAKGEWTRALIDFSDIYNLAPTFSDACANRGAIYIMRGEGADGAIKWFNLALKANPDFALALNGRGAAYFAQGKLNQAERDFESAVNKNGCLSVTVTNILKLEKLRIEIAKRQADTILASSDQGSPVYTSVAQAKQDLTRDYARLDRTIQTRENWRPVLDFTASVSKKVPGVGAVTEWAAKENRYMIQQGRQVLNKHEPVLRQHGIKIKRPGGVTSDMSLVHIDKGNWVVRTWFGLGYQIESE